MALISYGRENALRFLLLVQLGEHGLLLIRCQLADADSCVSPDGGENHTGPAEGCPRHIRERRHAQGGRHIGASGCPGQDRLEYGARVLYASTQIAGMQTTANVGRPQQLARQQEGDLAVAGSGYGQDAGQQGDDNQ